jgi:archaeosine-15-forming tRNA-guanine transglycosylase
MYNSEHERRPLSDEDARLLAALVAYPTKTAAAKALGIHRSTIYARLREEHIKAAYEEMRAEAIVDATDSLLTVAESAVSVLHKVANDPEVPAQTRVTAAGKILDLALKVHELSGVLARLEALEKELA